MYVNINEILLKKFRKDRGNTTIYGDVAVQQKDWSRLVQTGPGQSWQFDKTAVQSSPVCSLFAVLELDFKTLIY